VDAYVALRGAIITGALQPNERLVEDQLAQSLGVGRAAVRNALIRLEQERLIEHERNRGARVRLVSVDEALEILEARRALEALTAGRAAEQVTKAEARTLRGALADMHALLDKGDLIAASDANAAFHRQIVEIARNETVKRLLHSLNSQMVRFQYRTILVPKRAGRSYEEHSAIVEAVCAGDARGAERAMRRHLTNVEAALRQAGPTP